MKKRPLYNVPLMGHNDFLPVIFAEQAGKIIRGWPKEVKKDFGTILMKIQCSEKIGFPDIAAMRTVAKGCFEIRVRGADGIYRAFYILESEFGILVFHSFQKKTQKTPVSEIDTAKRRLKMMLKDLYEKE